MFHVEHFSGFSMRIFPILACYNRPMLRCFSPDAETKGSHTADYYFCPPPK
jgi:hypothetical protein